MTQRRYIWNALRMLCILHFVHKWDSCPIMWTITERPIVTGHNADHFLFVSVSFRSLCPTDGFPFVHVFGWVYQCNIDDSKWNAIWSEHNRNVNGCSFIQRRRRRFQCVCRLWTWFIVLYQVLFFIIVLISDYSIAFKSGIAQQVLFAYWICFFLYFFYNWE